MSRVPVRVKKADVKRAIAGATAAGIAIDRVELADDGRIIIVAAKPENGPTVPADTPEDVRKLI